MHTYLHTYIHTYIHAYQHTYIHTYIRIYTYIHKYVCTNIHRVFCAVAFNYFYFAMLPYIDEPPEWCEDLGSLAFSTNPRSGAVRDGDKAQHWKEDPDAPPIPTKSELETMLWFERISYHIADFYHTHLRSLRVLLWAGARGSSGSAT